MNIEKINGYWVPSKDKHLEQWKSGGTFTQNRCLNKFIEHCNQRNIKFDTILDVGAWVGTWSMAMQPYAKKVITFEPDPLHYSCLIKNVPESIETHQLALGSEQKMIALDDNAHTQAKRVIGEGTIPCTTIDSLDLENIDLIKIDVEGYEMEVLKGADKTLETTKYIMIELNSNTERYGFTSLEVAKYIVNKGFKVLLEHWPDKVFVKK
tara:strand:- start:265 stop:891 length:627 start_codon:yes stop_codon:yes gene_type:complete